MQRLVAHNWRVNMKTDRELLEGGAQAAGYKVHAAHQAMRDACGAGDAGLWLVDVATCWNPLIDDGDALRLAVKLRMAMDIGEYGLVAFCGQGLAREVKNEDIDGDPYAATRRAIVRASAAMADVPAVGAA